MRCAGLKLLFLLLSAVLLGATNPAIHKYEEYFENELLQGTSRPL